MKAPEEREALDDFDLPDEVYCSAGVCPLRFYAHKNGYMAINMRIKVG